MEFCLHVYIIPLFLLLVGGQVWAVTPEMYWNKVLPNTPMPTAIQTSIPYTGGKKGSFVAKPEFCLVYNKATPKKEVVHYLNQNGETYMLETQMSIGRTLQVRLQTHTQNKATFLPLSSTDSIPFSSQKLPQILSKFSIHPSSKESAVVEETIRNCESHHQGEHKLCATSLEAMVSFAKSKLGNEVTTISSTSSVGSDGKIKYKITGVKKLVDYESAASVECHKEKYPYAVFSCHQVEMTALYEVSMVGIGDGNSVKAAVACHKDTSWWNPKHLSFQLLKTSPGKTTPVCHFLDDLAVVWTRK